MPTPAQIDTNSQNRTTDGLAGACTVLPCEDGDDYRQLLDSYLDEYRPVTPTERFFVNELAQAQWRLMRADAIEAELMNPGENLSYAAIAATFRDSDALTRLARYADSARRAYYKAQEKLAAARCDATRHRREQPVVPVEAPPPPPSTVTNVLPMPLPLKVEYESHLLRDPDFDPRMDASQMSKKLRRWFERHGVSRAA